MNKRLKNRVLAGGIALALVAVVATSCGKYDKMDIYGEWTIDLKEAKKLNVESAIETMHFSSGGKYTERHEVRAGNLDRWEVKGDFERKNNKIILSNRVKDTEGKMKDETYKYKIKDDKLILIVKGEDYNNDEKIYTKKKSSISE